MDIKGNATQGAYVPYADRLKAVAEARTDAGLVAENASPSSVFTSVNNTLFGMANLMRSVRALQAEAKNLRATDTAGLEAMRKEVSAVLSKMSEVGPAGGRTSAANTSTAGEKPMTLAELRSTLAEMQNNLQSNFDKLGKNMMKALAYREPPQDLAKALRENRASTLFDVGAALRSQAEGLRSTTRYF